MTTALTTDTEARCVRKLFWRLLPFLFLLYIVNYLDRINISFAKLQMQAQLGFSEHVFGLGFGIFFLGYFILQVPSNLALQRAGARRWIAMIMVLWGMISCCMVLIRTPREFYFLRFLLGATEAGFFPGVILYLKNWFPAGARARAFAWFMTANPLAGVIGAPISGVLLGVHKFGIAGWKWMFLMEGAPAIILAAVVLFSLKDRPDQASWLDSEEREWLMAALEREGDPYSTVTRAQLKGAILRLSWQILLLTVVYFGLAASVYGIVLWLPSYIHSVSSLSELSIAIVSVIPYVATTVAMVTVGALSDRTGKHRVYLATSAFSAALFLFISAYTSSIGPGLTFVSLALAATFCMQGPFWATATSLMSGTAAAAGIAVINALGNLGGFYGPYIISLGLGSSGKGFRGGMLVLSAFLVLAGTLALLVRLPRDHPSLPGSNPLQ